ncbi:MAG TPA: hypothetical protein PKU91_01755, partial [Phycisphaerales bacterium]|nr:hypothetical protein [Phycisphaerales bacterium]
MPILKNLLPRMFHRRVILLLAGVGVASSVLGIRMARMASGSDQALMAAESRLVRRQMTPTVRGRILDRLGRVLAQDRPSYDVAVSYAVVSGEWPREQARAFVRKAYREQWSELTADRREELINRAAGVFERHVRSGWEIISATSGVSAAEVEKTRDEALGSVIRMHEAIGARRLRSELAAFRSRTGRDPDEPEMASIRRRASAPLREMAQPRVILPRVSDQVAFAFQAMAEEQVELRPLGSDP